MFPILFEFGPFSIHALWFFVSLGFIFGCLLFARLAKRYRLRLDAFSKYGFVLLITTLIGARLIYVITHVTNYNFITIFSVWDRGFSLWGAVIGFFIPLYFLTKESQESFWRIADSLTLPILLAFLFGHMGAFFDGVAHGSVTNLPWGITFQSAAVKYAVPIHPTQLYAFIYTFALFIAFWKTSRYWILKTEGFTFKMMLWSYSLFRFLEEFFRGDDVIMLFGIIRVPQLLALLVCGFLTWHFLVQKKETLFQETAQRIFHSLRKLPSLFHWRSTHEAKIPEALANQEKQ